MGRGTLYNHLASGPPLMLPSSAILVHGTAIVLAETGILFTGPSGSGKSETALRCLQAAHQRGWHAALIADDAVLVQVWSGRVLAVRPEATAGLLELRGTGILTLPARSSACLHLVVAPGGRTPEARLPPDDEREVLSGVELPMVRLVADACSDPLASLLALRPALFPR